LVWPENRPTAHLPSLSELVPSPLSPTADAGAPHVIPSEENGTNTEATERDPFGLLTDRVKTLTPLPRQVANKTPSPPALNPPRNPSKLAARLP
jgi:hypothetical protein